MPQPPVHIRSEDRIVLLSLLAGIGAWIIDAAVDALVFKSGTFLRVLILDVPPHDLSFRLFILLCFFLFGVAISGTLARRREAEEELRKALASLGDEKAKSEAVISAIPDGISIQNREFRIFYQNDLHRAIMGDQIGKTCYEAYSRRDSVCPDCPVAKAFGDGRLHTLITRRDTTAGTVFLEINAAPLRNARGEIVAGIEAVRDITARKQTEESLKLFSAAIDEAMDGVQLYDLKGTVLYSNKAVEELSGHPAAALTGKLLDEVITDRAFVRTIMLAAIREQGRWSGELTVRHADGRTFPVWLSASQVKDDQGSPIALVGIIRDITNRKRSEEELQRHRERLQDLVEERTVELRDANVLLQQEISERMRMEGELARVQKLESLGLLAGGIAHDFNNLLGAIVGNLSLAMLDVEPSHPAFKQLSKVESASLRAQDLTQQLLIFSRGGAPVKKPTSLSAVIAEAAGYSLRGSRVLHELALPGDLWPVDADEGQMMQVFSNLLINADQAMQNGGVIRITGENITLADNEVMPLPAGRYVKILVLDEGTGIPEEHLPKIFDPYFTTKQKGSGLGLAATYSIIRRHDGYITVASAVGKGSQFSLYLPASSGKVLPPPRVERLRMGTGKVLIMDDDLDMRNTTADMLKRLGYGVESVSDGARAVAAYQKARDAGEPFDVVIMDLTIPGGMGGQEAMRKIAEIDPDAAVIVSSGFSQDPVMADFRAYGFRGAVRKPYRIKELGEAVGRVFKDRAH